MAIAQASRARGNPLRILLIAPEPLFEERGTPIAVRMVIEELAAAGHDCDVLTYADDRGSEMAGCELIQNPSFGLLSGVPPGPSFKKVLCDVLLAGKLAQVLRRREYDIIHAVEEAVFLGLAAWKFYGIPYVYDMDSSMSQQIVDRWRFMRPARRMLETFERMAIRNSVGVLAVCGSLEAVAASAADSPLVARLEDVSLLPNGNGAAEDLRETTGATGPIVLYVGNLQDYQGIDLLLDGFAHAATQNADARLIIVGGKPARIRLYRECAQALGIADRVDMLGPRPVEALGSLLGQADILVSPRTRGSNTPMKIYSYMDSGRAILATRIAAHTQVFDGNTAMLTAPEPIDFGNGLLKLLSDPDLRGRLGARARERARLEHSRPAFRKKLLQFYARIARRLRTSSMPPLRTAS